MRFRKLKKQTKIKKEVQIKTYYASYPNKIKAFITDMFMIYTPILYILAYIILGGKEEFLSSQIAPLLAVSLYAIIYSILLTRTGQTPGKKAYNIKVVNAKNGDTISFLRALLRFVSFLFTATTLFGLFLPLYRKDKKALHDIMCGTIEIEER